jgi:hypothetical protein
MDSRRLLTLMADRLYDDIKFVAEQNPTQIVDEDGTRAYNALVQKARNHFPHIEHMADFVDWNPRTIKYKDALVASGQLAAMLSALVAEGVPSAPARIAPPTPHPPAHAPATPPPSQRAAPPQPPAPAPMPPQASSPSPMPDRTPKNFDADTPMPIPTRPAMPKPVKNPTDFDEPDHEVELYGRKPVKRNEDGTIPFSLD